jgi:hypothetical protein
MPKPKDLRLQNVSFQDALKRMISTPPPGKKAVKKAAKKRPAK